MSRALGQATRRLDVDTKWLRETGVTAAKDQISITEYLQIENQSEEKLDKVREPALKVAHNLLAKPAAKSPGTIDQCPLRTLRIFARTSTLLKTEASSGAGNGRSIKTPR